MIKPDADYIARKGDVLVIHVPVSCDADPQDTSVHCEYGYSRLRVEKEDIVGIYSRAWKVDDRVLITDGIREHGPGRIGEVAGVKGDHVWIIFPDGGYTICDSALVKPAPKE